MPLRTLLLVVSLLVTMPVGARSFGAVLHYLFVSHPDNSRITVVDTRDDSIAGSLDIGLPPSQLEGSGTLAKLVAIDGKTPRLHLFELTNLRLQTVALDFVPQCIVLSPNGLKAAVFSGTTGQLAVIDLLYANRIGPVRHYHQMHDVIFDREGRTLHIADDNGIARFEADSNRTLDRVGPTGAIIRLAPSATSRVFYATAADGTISAVPFAPGPRQAKNPSISAGRGVARAYTNATGTRLFLPDNNQETIRIVSPDHFRTTATLPAVAGLGHVYSAWFDTVAFIPTPQAVLVIDQERSVRLADIPLSEPARRGTVTPDGSKFILPLAQARSLVVIDAAHRRITKRITLEFPPQAALMAVTFGICH